MCYSNCKNENADGDCRGGRIDSQCHCVDDEEIEEIELEHGDIEND